MFYTTAFAVLVSVKFVFVRVHVCGSRHLIKSLFIYFRVKIRHPYPQHHPQCRAEAKVQRVGAGASMLFWQLTISN